MSDPQARVSGNPDPERLLDVTQVRDYRGPSLVLFIGISTAGSRVHAVFPRWSQLFCPGAILRGADLPADASPAKFRELVSAMAANPCVLGAVVTSHKLRLFGACADLIDDAEPLVGLTHEINGLDTRDGVRAFARDPQSLDVVLDEIGATGGTPVPRPMLCIGSGGSAIALMLAMRLDVARTLRTRQPQLRTGKAARGHLAIVGRRKESLEEVRAVQRRCGISGDSVDLLVARDQHAAAQHVISAQPGTVVINATGLGKTGPGSPLPEETAFPPSAVAWDFNYRGPLTFLHDARRAGVATEDGWDYFVAGWSAALAAVTGRELTPALLASALHSVREFKPA